MERLLSMYLEDESPNTKEFEVRFGTKDKSITINPTACIKTERQVIMIEEYFSLNLPKNNLLKMPIAPI